MVEKEYIEREAVYKACEVYFSGVCGYYASESEVINDFEKIIDSVPTADVASVKHGYWKQARYTEAPWYLCSECDNPEYKQHKYCPNCGTKMSSEKRNS